MPGRDLGITDREFEVFRELVHRCTGIHLGPQKRHLLVARLGRRLRALGLPSFAAYHRYLAEEDADGAELGRFVNAITTNKTDFFREAHHFRYLAERWIPGLRARAARGGERRVRLWSAACSTGEEPYTLALTLLEGLGTALGWDVRVLASDIDTECLARAASGVYTLEQVRPVPAALVRRYFLRGRGADAGRVQVRPEVRALVTFRRINFLDDPWPIRTRFDAIFCRNVLIYFDRATQQRILERLLGYLAPDGLLCLGHSEGVHGLAQGLVAVGHTIYRRAGAPARHPLAAPEPAR
jgi:chemotaxis protein methyltransferase CheR